MAKFGKTPQRPPAKLAIVGPPNSGKTVFICSNVALPVWALDSDGRFADYEHLLLARSKEPGETPDDLSVYVDPKKMYDLSREKQRGNAFKAVVVDSMTKPFQGLARSAHLANRASRRGEGESGNFSDRLQEKAMFISMVSSISALFEETWLVWHTYDGKDANGKDRIAETISKVERERLMQSLSSRLEFGFDEKKGYWVRPTWARDWRGIKANVGFTLYDRPYNYWAGGLERLFSVMYASFTGKDDAVAWGIKQTGLSAEDISKRYDSVKESVVKSGNKSASAMWLQWVMHIESV